MTAKNNKTQNKQKEPCNELDIFDEEDDIFDEIDDLFNNTGSKQVKEKNKTDYKITGKPKKRYVRERRTHAAATQIHTKAVKKNESRQIVLRAGESQRKNGKFQYRWTSQNHIRRSVVADTLEELRELENQINKEAIEEISTGTRLTTLNDIFAIWKRLKKGLKDNTFQNYCYMYDNTIKPYLGSMNIKTVKKTDIKSFYNRLYEKENYRINTIDSVHNILHQIFDIAVDDGYIAVNPAGGAMKELKLAESYRTEKRRGLTKSEQDVFLNFLRTNETYRHWYPTFAVLIGTGLRVGELTGLRWCDVDLDEGIINIDHTLVFYSKEVNPGERKSYFDVHSPKTHSSVRQVPMLSYVKEAFRLQAEYLKTTKIVSHDVVNGYQDFIFINRFGEVQHQGTLNKAIKRIIRDSNYEQLAKHKASAILLPNFSCHSLRHTFTTRMIESGVNLKVVQDTLGHSDFSTTMNIYTDATKDFKQKQFEAMDEIIEKTSDKTS